MRKPRLLLVALVAAIAAACAPKRVELPIVSTPKYPDFVQPLVPAQYVGTPAGLAEMRGWVFLQAGDVRNAELEFANAVKAIPAYPIETSLGYVAVVKKDTSGALADFDRSLARDPNDVAALVGRGQVLLLMNREADALPMFESAMSATSPLPPNATTEDIKRHVAVLNEVMKFRSVTQHISGARDAARAGRLDQAVAAYREAIAASPDSPFLYVEVAGVERRKGDNDAAIEHFRRAAALDPGDVRSRTQIGELLEEKNDIQGAIKAYTDAIAVESNPELEKRVADLQEGLLTQLPDAYRGIAESPQITRADLATLIAGRLERLVHPTRAEEADLLTDSRDSPAWRSIQVVVRSGIMDAYPNHTFGPRDPVTRAELAQTASRLLNRIAADHPGQPNAWDGKKILFGDMSTDHSQYTAASAAVSAGVMAVSAGNNFQPLRTVSGKEAADAIMKLDVLARRAAALQ
jgi:tetratricopeptide (TPR) repeat protein